MKDPNGKKIIEGAIKIYIRKVNNDYISLI